MSRQRWAGLLRNAAVVLGGLVLFFAYPTAAEPSVSVLVRNLLLVLVGVGLIGLAVAREVSGRTTRRLTVANLFVLLELVTLAFAIAYWTLEANDPGQLVGVSTRLDALYFTMTTMTTVGYGDVHAAGQLARALVTLHLAFDVVFLATFASLIRARVPHPGPDDPR